MPCQHAAAPGIDIFTCSRGAAERKTCSSCGGNAIAACAAELRGTKAGQLCGRHLCKSCNEGNASAPLCGPHARLARGR